MIGKAKKPQTLQQLIATLQQLADARASERLKSETPTDVARFAEIAISTTCSANLEEIIKLLRELETKRRQMTQIDNLVPIQEGITFGGDSAMYIAAYIRRLESKISQLSNSALG